MANNDIFEALSKKYGKRDTSPVNNLTEMFGLTENVRVTLLPIAQLREKVNHPFKVIEGEKLQALADSIRDGGLMQPIIVRESKDNTYEILSGHRRTRACQMNGETEIKSIIIKADDELANRIMISTNFQQRDTQLPSEIAKSYLIRYTDLKNRKKHCEENSTRWNFNKNSNGRENSTEWNFDDKIDKIMETEFVTSKSKVYLYLRLNHLIPELMETLDSKKLNIKVAAELSYISKSEQKLVYELVYEQELYKLDIKKASEIKRKSSKSKLTSEELCSILNGKDDTEKTLSFTKSELKRYQKKFNSYSDMKQAIMKFLDSY